MTGNAVSQATIDFGKAIIVIAREIAHTVATPGDIENECVI